jgi:PAS domain S-box-containing protein
MSTVSNASIQLQSDEAPAGNGRQLPAQFFIAAETARMAMVFTDARKPKNPIIFANDSFLSLTGYGRNELLGQSFDFSMAQHADAATFELRTAAFASNSQGGSKVLYRHKDGHRFWAAVFVSPERDEYGNIVQYSASFVDLSEYKDEQRQTRRLLDEISHRSKNTLSIVQSIVWQALQIAPDLDRAWEAIEHRLLALSRADDLLTRENGGSVGLRDVITDALEPFVVTGGRVNRIVITGEDIRFPAKAAVALGIGFNELATNAVKYGAFSTDAGSIAIDWSVALKPEGNRVLLRWRERDGPPVVPPSRNGFGSRMLERGLAYELEAVVDLSYHRDGLVCTMDIPAPDSRK